MAGLTCGSYPEKCFLETPLVYSATMEWEFEIRMDFKPSDQNHIRLHVYLDDQRMLGLKNDYYVQIGSNKKTITFRKHTATEKNPKILIEKALDVLLGCRGFESETYFRKS